MEHIQHMTNAQYLSLLTAFYLVIGLYFVNTPSWQDKVVFKVTPTLLIIALVLSAFGLL